MSRIFFFIFKFMSKFILFVLFIFSVSAEAKKLIILGDSLSEGYGVTQESAFPYLLQQKFKQNKTDWIVTSSGSSGSTSASTLSRLKWVMKEKPDVVLVLMGSNDALRGLQISETEKNLEAALKWAQEQKVKVILGQLYAPPNYGAEYSEKFGQIYPRLAKKYQIKLAPFLLDKVAGIANLNQKDGIHPNEKGHQLIADQMFLFLKKNL